jgi:hypothetical protein
MEVKDSMNNISAANATMNHFNIQPVGRFSLLIQTCLLPQANIEFSKHEDRKSYPSTEQVAIWGGLYPKVQRCLVEKIPIYSFILKWCTHFREKRYTSKFSV